MTALRTVCGQPSWRLQSKRVEAFVTRTGGQLAPVTFDLGRGRKVQPFAIAPWWNETLGRDQPAMLRVLRGDFFCMPFGGNDKPYRGERHPPHGETANRNWRLRRCIFPWAAKRARGVSINTSRCTHPARRCIAATSSPA